MYKKGFIHKTFKKIYIYKKPVYTERKVIHEAFSHSMLLHKDMRLHTEAFTQTEDLIYRIFYVLVCTRYFRILFFS